MKNKGFTLIELLAVIVILAIIALIAFPVINKIVDKSRKGAAEASALNYINAVEKYVVLHDLDSTKYPYELKNNTFNVADDTEISLLDIIVPKAKAEGTVPALNSFIKIKGDKPKDGTVTIDSKGKVTEADLVFGKLNVECTGNSCKVKGINNTPKVTLKIDSLESTYIKVSTPTTLTVTTNSNDTITWVSSDETVANVADGVVTGLKPGNVTITASIGSVTDSIELTIIGGPTKVDAASGETHKGIVYLNPTNFSDECDASNSLSTFGRKEGCMKWYVIDDSNSTYKILLDHNILKGIFLKDKKNNSNCDNCVAELLPANTSNWQATPRLISLDEIIALTGVNHKVTYALPSGFQWLYDNLENCLEYSCSVQDNNAGVAYWTSTTYSSDSAYFVKYNGKVSGGQYFAASWGGIRPVIEVPKNIF